MLLHGKALIAQGGGPTAVINQSLVGAVLEARKYPQITKVYGAIKGIEGILKEDFLDLSQETAYNLERVAITPSSALQSTRTKPNGSTCKEILEVFKKHDIRYFFYIGGNDSSDTIHIIHEYAKSIHYELRAIHIPKTIDNDLVLNDHTPGFPSAAKFVTQTFLGVNLDMRALGGIYIGVVMGRHAGFLTAAAAMGIKYQDDGPHLIYVPERPFSRTRFLADVKKVYEQYGRCVIAVSEGIQDREGIPIITKLLEKTEKDDHGNVQLSGNGALGDMLSDLIKEKLQISRVRADTFGYLQRSFVGCTSEVDRQEAREVGEKAVQFAICSENGGSVAMDRIGDYCVDYVLKPLLDIAGKTKHMSDEFINEEGNHVTEAFRSYMRPLLGNDLPEIHLLRAPKVC
ncbi:MAG: 6-phosphofructokinase [Vallitaleaceae bacterium]|nr:6-phosphofructokinase [Vallitaleaceae bacterium]